MARKRTEEKLEKRLQKVQEEKRLYDMRKEIKEIKREMRPGRKMETNKAVMWILMINFAIVEAYSMWIMWYLGDLSALYTLITTVLAEPITYLIYCGKAYAGKKQEEAVKLERDKLGLGTADELEADEGGTMEGIIGPGLEESMEG